jgi:5-methylcytosine-specific restriction endonuclease McrA
VAWEIHNFVPKTQEQLDKDLERMVGRKLKPYEKKGWDLFREDFIRNNLRRASLRWPAMTIAKKVARTVRRINPATGKLAWRVLCAGCGEEFLESEVAIDHREPVVPVDRDRATRAYSTEMLGQLMKRMLPEPQELQVLCYECHSRKTEAENEDRRR